MSPLRTIGLLSGKMPGIDSRLPTRQLSAPNRRRMASTLFAIEYRLRNPGRGRYALRQGHSSPRIGIGEHIKDVRRIFRPVFNATDLATDGSDFDHLFVREGVTEDEFVSIRTKRDATLAAPRLLLPSIQVNIRAGKFPPKQSNGVRYLQIPVKMKGDAELGL